MFELQTKGWKCFGTFQNHQCKDSITFLCFLGKSPAAAAVVPRKLPDFPGPPSVCWRQGLVQQTPEGMHWRVWMQFWRGCTLPANFVWRFHDSWSWQQSLHIYRRQGKGEWSQPVTSVVTVWSICRVHLQKYLSLLLVIFIYHVFIGHFEVWYLTFFNIKTGRVIVKKL